MLLTARDTLGNGNTAKLHDLSHTGIYSLRKAAKLQDLNLEGKL